MEITWPNISKSNTKLCHGNKMVESIWESQTTTSGKSCNYLQTKHGYYKGGEVVGKLALGIRPDMNSDSVALIINRVWKSRQVWTSTFTHLYFCVLPLTRKLCVVQMSRQNCLHVKICLKEKKKSFGFLAQERWSVELKWSNTQTWNLNCNSKMWYVLLHQFNFSLFIYQRTHERWELLLAT